MGCVVAVTGKTAVLYSTTVTVFFAYMNQIIYILKVTCSTDNTGKKNSCVN